MGIYIPSSIPSTLSREGSPLPSQMVDPRSSSGIVGAVGGGTPAYRRGIVRAWFDWVPFYPITDTNIMFPTFNRRFS